MSDKVFKGLKQLGRGKRGVAYSGAGSVPPKDSSKLSKAQKRLLNRIKGWETTTNSQKPGDGYKFHKPGSQQ